MGQKFRLRVVDIFLMKDKTALVGKLETHERFLGPNRCKLIVDTQERAQLSIEGESLFRRDLQSVWTRESVPVTREEVLTKEVWLVSE